MKFLLFLSFISYITAKTTHPSKFTINSQIYTRIGTIVDDPKDPATIYKVSHGRTLVIKSYSKQHTSFKPLAAKKEIEIMKRLRGLKNVVGLVDVADTNERIDIVMEFGDTDLFRYIRNRRLSKHEIHSIWSQMVASVGQMHSRYVSTTKTSN